jgi:putative transposase
VRARLVIRPEDWPWSSFPGYLDPARRLDWIDNERLSQAWRGDFGEHADDAIGHDARFDFAGVAEPPEAPFSAMKHGWILGSASFVRRLKAKLPVEPTPRGTPQAKALLDGRPSLTIEQVLSAVADYYVLSPRDLRQVRKHAQARSVVAWLCRRYTT